MKVAGIVLILYQCVAVFGSFAEDIARNENIGSGFLTLFQGGAYGTGIAKLIGFFLPAIIGVILLVKANKKKKGQ